MINIKDFHGEIFKENGKILGYIDNFPEKIYPDRVDCGMLKGYFSFPINAKYGKYFNTIEECKDWIRQQHKEGYEKIS